MQFSRMQPDRIVSPAAHRHERLKAMINCSGRKVILEKSARLVYPVL